MNNMLVDKWITLSKLLLFCHILPMPICLDKENIYIDRVFPPLFLKKTECDS